MNFMLLQNKPKLEIQVVQEFYKGPGLSISCLINLVAAGGDNTNTKTINNF